MVNLTLTTLLPLAHAAAGDIVGEIVPPTGIKSNPTQAGSFVSMVIVLIVVVAGLFTLWQFLSGGLDYITSGGDKGKIQQASAKITNSIIGIVIIAASFIIVAILGFILFGDPAAFLSPSIKTL